MSIFSKRQEKAMEIMRERNRRYLEDLEEQNDQSSQDVSGGLGYAFKTGPSKYDEELGEYSPEPEVELEKGDLAAIIISGLLVFWPVFAVLALLLMVAFFWWGN